MPNLRKTRIFTLLLTLGICAWTRDTPAFPSPKDPVAGAFEALTAEYASELNSLPAPLVLKRKLQVWNDAEFDGRSIIVGSLRGPYAQPHQIMVTLCHELGHLLGGAPHFAGSYSYEGQADYFAFSKCLKRMWKQEDNAAWIRRVKIDRSIPPICRTAYSAGSSDFYLCMRSLHSALEIARAYHQKHPKDPLPPGLDEHASYRLSARAVKFGIQQGATEPFHPTPQCRLDTMVAGVLCDADIHAGFRNDDALAGACREGTRGARPRCWYRP